MAGSKALYDPDAEERLLATALTDFANFARDVQPEDFHNKLHGQIWAVGQELIDLGDYPQGVNVPTAASIGDALERRGVDVGLLIAHLQALDVNPVDASVFARQVRDLAARRRADNRLQAALRATHYSNGTWRDEIVRAIDGLSQDLTQASPQADTPASHISLLTAAEALQPRPPRKWLVEKLFLPGSVNVMFAPPGTGKTYCFADLSVCVALGSPWLGLATQQGAVLIIDEESGTRRILDRFAEALRGHLADASTPVYIASLVGFNFRENESLATLDELIRKVGARLVVIDALADVMLGGDENAVKDTQPVFHGLRTVAEATGAAVLVVHHSNRGGAYRGSSAIPGAVDVMLELTRRNDSQLVDIATVKNRDGEPITLSAMMRWSDGIFDLIPAPTVGPRETFSKAERYVLRYLEEHGADTVKNIMDHADTCASTTARQAIYLLAEKNKVWRCDGGSGTQSATYCLVGDAK